MDRFKDVDVALMTQLLRLGLQPDATEPAAMHVEVRSSDGQFMGAIPLAGMTAEALTDAVRSLADYRDCPDNPYAQPGDMPDAELQILDATVTDLHPAGVADIEDHFADLDLVGLTGKVLSSVAPSDRLRATLAIDDMFGHIPTQDDLDGDL
ncbi:hypothetical protein ACFQ6Q_00545 [Streptomyces sp. NPDC056437]|uniref:hypothetical protein n=1 Tax=Streptomyces sp. NPDC056437 TaxID=3345816 RepID=UPI0036CC4ED9